MESLFIIEYGIKRKAHIHKCEYCEKEFLRRENVTRPKKYCSIDCKNKAKVKKIEVKCANCGKNIYKNPSKLKNSKHGYYFCNRKCKEEAQSLKGNCLHIRPSHYGTSEGREVYKNLIRNSPHPICEGCGENCLYLLQVHHKDGNRNNNTDKNFEILCSNCHIKRHLKLIDGKWVFNTKSLTPRNLLDIL